MLVVANEEEHFAALVAGDIEGVVGDLHEISIGNALEEHGTPLIVSVQVSEGSEREPVSVADLIDAQHWTAEAIGMDSAGATITGKGEHDGTLHVHELSIDSAGLRVVVVRKFPSAIEGQGLFIAGGPHQYGESDQERTSHTGHRVNNL
jgi:hypothetical protein